jgi:hypothetical protein
MLATLTGTAPAGGDESVQVPVPVPPAVDDNPGNGAGVPAEQSEGRSEG